MLDFENAELIINENGIYSVPVLMQSVTEPTIV